MNKAVFLDRDGVINEDRVDYVHRVEDFIVLPGVTEGLKKLKNTGFKLIVITNQSGIAKGIYTHEDVRKVHYHFQEQCNNLIDHFYYAPWHPDHSESLTRKPGTLLFERAICRYKIDPERSWMVGDRERDLKPAKQLGISTILLDDNKSPSADYVVANFEEVVKKILVTQDL